MLKKNKLRYNEYYDMQHIYDELYAQSKNGNNFYKLLEIIGSEQNICLAYRNLKSNSGSKTAGTDGMTIDDIKQLSNAEIVATVRESLSNYRPKSVRRVFIPKAGSDKMRPLGIPCIWDRLVQQCILQVLKVKDIARHTTGFNISRYNLTVIGMQNYYCIATNVYNNLTEVSYALLPTIRIRLRNIAKSVPFESTSSEFQSRTKGIRPKTKIVMIADNPLLPIQGVQHKNPMNFSQDICNFTKQGRNKVHEDVVVVTKEEIRALLENENPADSVEFNDNRISAYIAQQGNCYVMNRRGTPSTLICIHKSDKGDNLDRYSNLAFVELPIAKAILTESADEAKSLLKGYVLNSQQKKKLNRIRTNYGYQTITGK